MKIDRFIVALTSSDRFIELQPDPEGSLCFASEVVKLEAINAELLEALEALHHAVCGETGFAEAVRNCSGIAYPWEPLDAADLAARAAIAKAKGVQP